MYIFLIQDFFFSNSNGSNNYLILKYYYITPYLKLRYFTQFIITKN